MDMSEHSIKDLGTFVDMFAEAGYFKMARTYLNEIAMRLGAMEALKGQSSTARMVRQLRENDLLVELPYKQTDEPTLKHEPLIKEPVINNTAETPEPLADEARRRGVTLEQVTKERLDAVLEQANEVTEEPAHGLIRDENGKVTHISVQAGEPGYDPEIHENTALKIYCDNKWIENAHTADTVAGVVKYYKKNEQGRIKTLTVHGKVEIKGLN